MKLTLRRYTALLSFQLTLLIADLVLNSSMFWVRNNRFALIFIFLTQDLFIIFAYVLLGFGIYSTFIYKAGLVDILIRKFRFPLMSVTIYFILSIAHHFWIVLYDQKQITYQWSTGLNALLIIHRLFSPVYYYLYKRTAFLLSDPRYHESMDWTSEHLTIK